MCSLQARKNKPTHKDQESYRTHCFYRPKRNNDIKRNNLDKVKTYQHVNKLDDNISFRISKMEDHYDGRKGQLDEPHRHDYFTVLITITAKGKHIIDFNKYDLSDNQIFFISPGQVHQLIEDEKSIGFILVFSNQFLIHNDIPLCFIDDLNLFNTFSESPPLTYSKEDFGQLKNYCDEMMLLNSINSKYQYQTIGAYLKLFLINCNNICTIHGGHTQLIETGNAMLKNFRELLNQKFKSWHSVTQYANALNITSDHLNRVVKSLTAKSAKEHIQERIVIAAKRLLYYSGGSSKEIAYELGFSVPAHFSQFFKKCTGIPPSQFRQQG